MPLYEYVCQECSHQFELIVHRSTVPVCPRCETSHIEKQLSAFAVSGGEGNSEWEGGSGSCGTCGDPRGPGACAMD